MNSILAAGALTSGNIDYANEFHRNARDLFSGCFDETTAYGNVFRDFSGS